jgi:hypothetical protein
MGERRSHNLSPPCEKPQRRDAGCNSVDAVRGQPGPLCGGGNLAHTRPMLPSVLRQAFLALLTVGAVSAAVTADSWAQAAERPKWIAGGYSFSDELGGFIITGISGSGTKDDPVVIEEELDSTSPVTLVIRAESTLGTFSFGGDAGLGFTHFRFVARNNSNLAWIEFEFELQEVKDMPSLFGDGLSFDQRRTDGEDIHSDSFDHFSRDFEPYDRLRFTAGKVDPLDYVSFEFLVTDFTPRWQYYIVQDPHVPSS